MHSPNIRTVAGELPLVLIRGAGDLASGVAIRLYRSGFPVVMTEIERPLVVRRTVAFAQAVFDGETAVEGVRAQHVPANGIDDALDNGVIPVLTDPVAACRQRLAPRVLVDAIMAKRNTGTRIADADLVIGLGPGFVAGVDCHAVVETNRGHNLGRVNWQGAAEEDTGRPGVLPGAPPAANRALYAPAAGRLAPYAQIGDRLEAGTVFATLRSSQGEDMALTAPFDGVLRGLIHPTVEIAQDLKIGDLDPRIKQAYCYTVSDKSLAIGGGVLEAIMSALHCGRTLHPEGK